jgi:hypothetical protein
VSLLSPPGKSYSSTAVILWALPSEAFPVGHSNKSSGHPKIYAIDTEVVNKIQK